MLLPRSVPKRPVVEGPALEETKDGLRDDEDDGEVVRASADGGEIRSTKKATDFRMENIASCFACSSRFF